MLQSRSQNEELVPTAEGRRAPGAPSHAPQGPPPAKPDPDLLPSSETPPGSGQGLRERQEENPRERGGTDPRRSGPHRGRRRGGDGEPTAPPTTFMGWLDPPFRGRQGLTPTEAWELLRYSQGGHTGPRPPPW